MQFERGVGFNKQTHQQIEKTEVAYCLKSIEKDKGVGKQTWQTITAWYCNFFYNCERERTFTLTLKPSFLLRVPRILHAHCRILPSQLFQKGKGTLRTMKKYMSKDS